ncbi:MAG TPA: outer membrane protein assembly factor BamA [Acetobacteraceae bacterium]|nr:outer membrane protein assembly factor BamA [Acetobacteraceae bacterium]
MRRRRAALILAACLLSSPALSAPAPAPAAQVAPAPTAAAVPPATAPAIPPAASPVPSGGTIQSVQVEGNKRIDAATILSYMLVRPGDPFAPGPLSESVKTLYATGLFQDVSLTRQGNVLLVHVVENPLVNQVAFEGNHVLNDTELRQQAQLRTRSVFTPAAAEADRQRILDAYAQKGYYDASVEPEIIRLPENRVNVVFQINDGPATLISRISFVGNQAFGEGRLAEVINSREERWWKFLSTSDQYSPQRLDFDKELLRRFYLHQGYIDFRVTDATAELAPDRKGFFLTFTVSEGGRYRVAKVSIHSQLKGITDQVLAGSLQFAAGDWYDGDAVGRTADDMENYVRNHGFAFVQVTPQIDRHPDNHSVNIAFDVGEGPRVYVERIDIVGNQRTEDRVIRRQFRIAEGDAFNAESLRQTRQRLTDLGYFQNVDITTKPGSAPDRALVTTTIQEKATGELSLGGGYSTDAGFLVDIGLRERNLVGTGIDAAINGILAQKRSSIQLSVTQPYFLDRNLLVGGDLFLVQTNNLGTEPYDERREGFAFRTGYDFTDHVRQVWSYSLVGRTVFDIQPGASFFITSQSGYTLLSQISQVLTIDYRDSTIDPHRGYITTFGSDFAGLGGNARFVRTRVDAGYYLPLDRFTGNSDWGIALTAGAGYFFNLGRQESVIDRFYLGGDNLRGFETGGVGPHDETTGDSLGGRVFYTESQQLNFPLPLVSPDLGLSGHAFVDIGALAQGNFESGTCPGSNLPSSGGSQCPPVTDSLAPRVGAGFGVSWRSGFGLINVDVTPFVVKQPFDQTQIFRFGFGTRF